MSLVYRGEGFLTSPPHHRVKQCRWTRQATLIRFNPTGLMDAGKIECRTSVPQTLTSVACPCIASLMHRAITIGPVDDGDGAGYVKGSEFQDRRNPARCTQGGKV